MAKIASNPPTTNPGEDTKPADVAKAQFAQRIFSLMRERGWDQATLGRRAGLGRDVINSYVHGRSMPTSASASKLANAFGINAHQLYPGGSDTFSTKGNHAAPLVTLPAEGNKLLLQMNLVLPMAVAAQVMLLVEPYMPADS